MHTIYERILSKKKVLDEKIKLLEEKLSSFPKGELVCTRNRRFYKWYHSDGHHLTYIPKEKREYAEQLAEKKYLSLLLEDYRQEIRALEFYLRHHKEGVGKAEQLLLKMPEYQNLFSSRYQTESSELLDWMKSPYESSKKYPEQLIHRTSSGHMVRSKSEALIDMVLYMHKIPFRYECALSLGDAIVYPDFTLRHPDTGEFVYWEHFGKMDDPVYCKNACSKLQLYTGHGIIPGINLITTYETKQHPLGTETIEHIVEEYFA